MHNDGWHEAAALYNLIKKLLVAALCVKAWCCRFEYGGKDLITLAITDIGDFTRKLLIQNVFDQFYVLEGEVSTFAAFTIDGELNEITIAVMKQSFFRIENGVFGRRLSRWLFC